MRNPSFLLAFVSLVVVACSDSGPAGPAAVPVALVVVTAPVTELQLGDSAQLGITVTAADGAILTDRVVAWTSGNPSVLRVSAAGVVTGIGAGTTSVTASVEGRTANASLTVHSWNVADHAVIVDSTNVRLVSDSAEGAAGRLRFHLVQGASPPFTAGKVVVGAQGGGFLRRITSITTSGTEITLETEPAALADIVEAGGFETSIDLIFAPGVSPAGFGAAAAALRPGAVLWREGRFTDVAPGAKYLPRSGMMAAGTGPLALFDLSGVDVCKVLALSTSAGGSACPDQLKKLEITNGSLDFEPDLDLEASFSGFSLDEFRGVVKGSLTLDLLLSLEAEGSLGELKVEPTFFTFTRPFFAQIGPVPVVGYVELEMKGELSLKATAKGAMDAGYEASGTVEIGASYNGTSWEPIVEGSGTFEPRIPSFAEGTLKGNVEFEAKVSMKPRAQIIFYGVIGPFAEAEPFGTATLTLGTSCGLKTDMAVNAAYGFTIPFLDSKVSDFKNDVKPLIQGPQSEWQCPLGTIDVNTTTNGTGADAASGGYSVVIDGEEKGTVAATGQLVVENIEVGSREVVLSDVPGNCTVQGGNTRTVAVATGNVHGAKFVIDCTELTGEIEVTTRTTGGAPDPDGYTVSIGGASFAIGINETITVDNIGEGTAVVMLSGLAGNCDVSSANPVNVEVVADETAEVGFDVNCAATELIIHTSTSGPPASTTGWSITLDGADIRAIAPNGQVTYTTTPGEHNVALNGLPDNCESTGSNPVVVDVADAGATGHTFNVQCEGAGLNVSVTTDGDPDPATSYTVTAGGQTQSIGVNGSASFGNLPAGSMSVLLGAVPGHCTVQGLNPRNVDVPGSSNFEVVCEAPTQCTEPPAHSLSEYVEVYPGSVAEGGVTDYLVTHTFGNIDLQATVIAPPDESTDGHLVWLGWMASEDHLMLVPVDASRANEEVELRIQVTSYGEVTADEIDPGFYFYAQSSAITQFNMSVIGGDGTNVSLSSNNDGNATQDNSTTIRIRATLGSWTPFGVRASAIASARDGGKATARATIRIDELIDVRDLNGQTVPIAQVCSASGTTY